MSPYLQTCAWLQVLLNEKISTRPRRDMTESDPGRGGKDPGPNCGPSRWPGGRRGASRSPRSHASGARGFHLTAQRHSIEAVLREDAATLRSDGTSSAIPTPTHTLGCGIVAAAGFITARPAAARPEARKWWERRPGGSCSCPGSGRHAGTHTPCPCLLASPRLAQPLRSPASITWEAIQAG